VCSFTQFQPQVVKLMQEMTSTELLDRLEQLAALQPGAVVYLMLPTGRRIYLGKAVVTQRLYAAEGKQLRDRYRLRVRLGSCSKLRHLLHLQPAWQVTHAEQMTCLAACTAWCA